MKSLAQTVTPWDGVGGRKDGPRRQGGGGKLPTPKRPLFTSSENPALYKNRIYGLIPRVLLIIASNKRWIPVPLCMAERTNRATTGENKVRTSDLRIMRYLVILVLCRCATIMTQALTHIAKNTCVRIMNIGLSILYEA